jgi:hypothetical protein
MMRYCEISKEMSSLYFGLPGFCLFEATVPEFDTQPPPPHSSVMYIARILKDFQMTVGLKV